MNSIKNAPVTFASGSFLRAADKQVNLESIPLKTSAQFDNASFYGSNVLLAALGAAGVALVVGVSNILKPNSKNLNTAAGALGDFLSSAVKFVNKNNEEISDVVIKNGRAFLPNGSGFSGIMQTLNKKGDKVELLYEEGFMRASYINDVLSKKYEQLKSLPAYIKENLISYARKDGVKIACFRDNKLTDIYMHIYDGNGKVRRTVHQGASGAYDALDISNGRIAAKTFFENLKVSSKIYDDSGTLIREVIPQKGPLTFIKRYLPDGSRIEVGAKILYDIVDTPASHYRPLNPKIVKYYSPNSDIANRVIQLRGQKMFNLLEDVSLLDKNRLRSLEIKLPKQRPDSSKNAYITITLSENGKTLARAIIDENGRNLAQNDQNALNELKNALQQTIFAAKEEGLRFNYAIIEKNLSSIFGN